MLSRLPHSIFLIVLISGALTVPLSPGFAQTTPASGPLRVHPTNPRYFTDAAGGTVYLAGSHVWNNLQDGNGITFDYTAYLDLMKSHNQNFIRLHVSETPRADVGVNPAPGWNGTSPWYQSADPLPFSRTGTGTAADGLPKFDLYRWNQAYFDRLRARVMAAKDRGIYVGIMLFNAWTTLNRVDTYPGRNTWRYHPFHPNNNTNGINGDPNGNGVGEETHMLQVAAITQIQEAYVRKVVDTVNDLDNVLYEISHEDVQSDPAWQYHLINVIKNYEATKPKQHPVGMTGSPQIGTTVLLGQPGSWTSFAAQFYNNPADPYAGDPPAADGARISLLDTDHIGYTIFRDDAPLTRAWVWKSFLRGHHTLLMEDLGAYAGWKAGRSAMGHARSYAVRMNLGTMTPQNSLATTGYCLASIGNEYLIYQDGSGAFSVNLAANAYTYEWFNPATGSVASTGTVGATGGNQLFTPPFQGPAVLYLKVSGILSSPAQTQDATAAATTYRASTDFSGIQGQGGWYYQDSQGRLMTYDATGGYWQGAETYLRLWRNGAHPGDSAEAVRRWVAPGAGTVHLTGRAADGDSGGGGGVTVLIRQGSTVLWQQALTNGNTTGLTFDLTTTVTAGTSLDFIVNRGADGSSDYDSTSFDPTITFVGTGSVSSTTSGGTTNTTTGGIGATTQGTTIGTAGTAGTTGTLSPPPSGSTTTQAATTYRASTDFSGIQGQGGWYYQDSQGRLMTYDTTGGYWQGAETYLRLMRTDAHPGNGADAVRRWVAPSAGTVRITGLVADRHSACGGGITALIRQGTAVLWQQAVANGNSTGISFDLATTVSAGTAVDFVLNRGADGNWDCDSTAFDPTITYTAAAVTTVPAAVQPSVYSANLLWSPNTESDLAGYRIYQRTGTGTYGAPVSIGKVTSYAATGLVSGVRYYFRVTAIDTSGNESSPSPEVSVLK